MPVRTRAQTKALRDKKTKALQKQKEKVREYKKTLQQKQALPNIVFNAARSGKMKIKQGAHTMERYCFTCRKPANSAEVKTFVDNYLKTNFKDARGEYWISGNFVGIGWRSSKKIDLHNPDSNLFNPADFEIYFDNYNTKYTIHFDQPVTEFHIYILQSSKTNAGGATINKYNDCLFNALEKAMNGNMPKEISSQPKLKKFLGLERADPVPIEMISKIQPLFKDISITVSGDYYRLVAEKPLNIHLHLEDNHYYLKYNKPNRKTSMARFKPVKPECVWAYVKESIDKYVMFNGTTTKLNVNHDEFTKIRKDFGFVIVKADSLEELTTTWTTFIENARETLEQSDDFINMLRYPCLTVAAQDIWRQSTKVYNVAHPMEEIEQQIHMKAFRGGLLYCEKGAVGNGTCYDINSNYPSIMKNQYFQIPVKRGVAMKLTAAEFNELKYFKYGIYNAVVVGTSKLFKPAAPGFYYTHFDLTLAKELGLEIRINDEADWNFFSYDNNSLVKGSLLFGSFVERLYKLKLENPTNKTYKRLLSSLWGKLCEKNRLRKIVKDNDDVFELPAKATLQSIEVLDGGLKLKYYPDSSQLYKNNLARLGCFLTSYTRLNFVRQIKKYEPAILRIHTDSIILKEDCVPDFKLSTDLGAFKIEKTGRFQINHVNSVEWA
jgi:hypothetical protein